MITHTLLLSAQQMCKRECGEFIGMPGIVPLRPLGLMRDTLYGMLPLPEHAGEVTNAPYGMFPDLSSGNQKHGRSDFM